MFTPGDLMGLTINNLFNYILFVLALLVFMFMIYELMAPKHGTDVDIISDAIIQSCSGESSINVSLPERSKNMVELVKGRDPKKYILLQQDPRTLLYYEYMSPLDAYAWTHYISPEMPSVAYFGLGQFRKGQTIRDFSSKVRAYASSVGFPESLGINLFTDGSHYLILQNVVGSNQVLMYRKGHILINESSNLSSFWKFFMCKPGSYCTRVGSEIRPISSKSCTATPYIILHKHPLIGHSHDLIVSRFYLASPCRAVLDAKSMICKCKKVDVPVFIYDNLSDSAIVYDVEETCMPSWFSDSAPDEVPCIGVQFDHMKGFCYSKLDNEISNTGKCNNVLLHYSHGLTQFKPCPGMLYKNSGYYNANCSVSVNGMKFCGASHDARWKAG